MPEIFGIPVAYYNPSNFSDRPYRDMEARVGFYEVKDGSGSKEIVCEISKKSINAIILLPLAPGEAMRLFETQGWPGCEQKAVRVVYPSRQENAAAVAA
jgi:hypothetical protein